jgi:hypothetical protein
LLGVFSSLRYPALTQMNRKREITHLLFQGELVGGEACLSDEVSEIGWFPRDGLPDFSEGHASRVEFGFRSSDDRLIEAYFE